MIQARLEERARKFQNPIDVDDFKRRREEDAVELRKQRRYERSSKKRALVRPLAAFDSDFPASLLHPKVLALAPNAGDAAISARERLEIVLKLFIECEDVYPVVETLKKVLSSGSQSPLEYVAQDDVIRRFLSLLSSPEEQVTLEVLWCLTNLAAASIDVARRLVDQECLPALQSLMRHTNPDVSDLAVWTLSNIIGDAPDLRTSALKCGTIFAAFELLAAPESLSPTRAEHLLWLAANVVLDYPADSEWDAVAKALRVVPWALASEHEDIVIQACWILAYISDNGNFHTKILEMELIPQLIAFVQAQSEGVRRPALRCVGNLATGDDEQTQELLDAGLLNFLSPLISEKNSSRKEAIWCLSNITAGNRQQVLTVFSHPISRELMKTMNDCDLEIRREAVWAASNAFHTMERAEVAEVVALGVLESLVETLQCRDPRMLLVTIEAVLNLLKNGDDSLLLQFERLGGVDALERLQNHPNLAVYNHALSVLNRFFSLEEVPSLPTLPPVSHYQFS